MTGIKSLTVTPQTSLEDVQRFLGQAKDGEKVFGTKSAVAGPNYERLETTTLYLAENANFKTVGKHNHAHAHDQSRHRVTGRELIAGILKNTVRQSQNSPNVDTAHAAYKTDVNTLLTDAIDRQVWDGKTAANRFSKGDAPTAAKLLDLTNLVKTTTDRTAWISENYKTEAPEQTLPASTNRVVGTLQTDVTLPNSTDTIALPGFEIGGKTFAAEKILGVGGFGAAVRYKEVDGDAVKIIKVPHEFNNDEIKPEDLETHLDDVTHERLAADRYVKPGSHIQAYTDHVVLDNGSVALIGDAGGHGDVFDFAETMHKANLSPHARRLVTLTMTKDMGESLTALHDAGGLHNDMKPENQVVGTDGHINLIDLGFAEPGPKVLLTAGHKYTANNDYNAPEAQLHLKNHDREVAQAKARMEARGETIAGELDDLLEACGQADTRDAFWKKHADTAGIAVENEAHSAFAMDGKADVYGIGGSAFMLATGKSPHLLRHARAQADLTNPTSTEKPTEADIKAQRFYKKSELSRLENSHGISYLPKADARPFDNEALIDTTGDPVFDLLLDDLLAPNANQRTAEREIANHPTMKYGEREGKPAIDSDEVRALIIAIAKGDKEQIALAEEKLLAAFPKPRQEELAVFEKMLAIRADNFTASTTRPNPPPAKTPDANANAGVSDAFLMDMQKMQDDADEASVDDKTKTDVPQPLTSFLQDTAKMYSRDSTGQNQGDEDGISTSPML